MEPPSLLLRRVVILLFLPLLISVESTAQNSSSWIVYSPSGPVGLEALASRVEPGVLYGAVSGSDLAVSKEAAALRAAGLSDFRDSYSVLHTPSGPSPHLLFADLVDAYDLQFFRNHSYQLPRLDGAELSHRIEEEDPLLQDQWGHRAIDLLQAWLLSTGSATVIIGVLDTGIDFDHPDLIGQVFVNGAEDINANGAFDPWPSTESREGVSGDLDGIDQDRNGFVDDVSGYDFVDQVAPNLGDWSERDPVAEDDQGHGTLVSGVIGAKRDNGIGIAGVAPGCRIMPLRAFDANGDGEDDDIAAAIVYAADNGVDVLNMSFGDLYRSPLLADAVAYARDRGVVMVASSGNNGVADPHYPSGFSGVMSVGALREDSLLSIFSAFGSHLSLVAPGEDVLTTDLGGGFRSVNGTSFSAPHVAGVAGLLFSLHGEWTAEEVRDGLERSAREIGQDGWDTDFGSGVLNAEAALERTRGGVLTISSPGNDSGVAADGLIPVRGSAAGIGLKTWDLSWGRGELPSDWIHIGEGKGGVLDDDLGMLRSIDLPDTTVTIRLRAFYTDGTSNERRHRLYVDRTPVQFETLVYHPIWMGDRQGLFVEAFTDDLATAELHLYRAGDLQPLSVSRGDGRIGLTRTHYWLVSSDEIVPGDSIEIDVVATTPGGLRSSSSSTLPRPKIEFPDVAAPVGTFIESDVVLPYGYMLQDRFGASEPEFLLSNRFENLSFFRTVLYRRDGEKFEPMDSVGNWVPRGIGDSDGDGLLESLLQATGKGIITEQSVPGGSLFSSVEFADTLTGRFYPGGFLDVDNDGRDEIAGYRFDPQSREDYLTIWRRDGAALSVLAEARNPTRFPLDVPTNSFGASDLTASDIDRDGYMELLVGDSDGDVILYSYTPDSGLTSVWTLEGDGIESDKLILFVDLDGDGSDEIVVGSQSDPTLSEMNEYNPPLWTLRGFSVSSEFEIEELFQERFSWPRPTSQFRSGISSGDLDGRGGEELTVTFFPNAYVFSWNPLTSKLDPLWTRTGSMINRPIVVENRLQKGVNEVAVGDGLDIRLYRFDTATNLVRPPAGLNGWSIGSTRNFLTWNLVGGETAQLFRSDVVRDGSSFTLVGETTESSFTDTTGLIEGRVYAYLVVALSENQIRSRSSNIVRITPHAPAVLVGARSINSSQIVLRWSGLMPTSLVRAGAIDLVLESSEGVSVSTILPAGDSTLLVTLSTPAPGTSLRVRPTSLLRDRSGSPVDTTTSLFVEMAEDLEPVSFYAVEAVPDVGERRIRIWFSTPPDPGTLTPDAFELYPPGDVLEVEPVEDSPETVDLVLPESYPLGPLGYTYSITIEGVTSTIGEEIPAGPGGTVGFTLPAETLTEVRLYPQPLSIANNSGLLFLGLPTSSRIEMYTPAGRMIRTIESTGGRGAVEWDGLDVRGEEVPPGVYIYRVTSLDSSGEALSEVIGKLAVTP